MRALLLILAGCRIGFDATGDASLAIDDSGVVSCNGIDRVRDDFEDGLDNINLWGASYSDPGTSVVESNGDLEFVLAANSAATFVGHKTMRFYDLRGRRIVSEVVQVANGSATTGLNAELEAMTYLNLSHSGGLLRAAEAIAGSYVGLASIPYDGTQRFWAIREDAGRIYFETSSDGTSFIPFFDTAPPFDVSLVRVTVFAGTSTMTASPGHARFASVGLAGSQPSSTCPASTLQDRFDDGVIGADWKASYTNPCCTQVESGGVLTFTTDGSAVGNVTRRSSMGLDLRNGEFAVTLVAQPTQPVVTASLTARVDDLNFLELQVSPGQTAARSIVDSAETRMTEPRDASEVHLRIREFAGDILYEVSADKLSWRTLRAIATPFPVDDVNAVLRLGVNGTGGPDQVSFDDFNVP